MQAEHSNQLHRLQIGIQLHMRDGKHKAHVLTLNNLIPSYSGGFFHFV